MTAPTQDRDQAEAELRAAEAAVAGFDESRLFHEDMSPNAEAQAEFARLRERLAAARARVTGLQAA